MDDAAFRLVATRLRLQPAHDDGQLQALRDAFSISRGEHLRSMRFLAHGPNRVWKNRQGTGYDVFAKAYNTTERGLLKVNDVNGYTASPSEFRRHYSNSVVGRRQHERRRDLDRFSQRQHFPADGPEAVQFSDGRHAGRPGFCEWHLLISRRHSPIADKFQSPPNLGPESNWNMPAGATFNKTVYFKFDPDEAPGVIPAPFVFAGADSTAVQGIPFASAGSFTDEGATGSWTGIVDYGDGSGSRPLPLTGKTFALHHTLRRRRRIQHRGSNHRLRRPHIDGHGIRNRVTRRAGYSAMSTGMRPSPVRTSAATASMESAPVR